MKNRHIAQRLVKWFGQYARDLPWRRTRDPYAIWVSEIMLQQTQVKTVVPYWERWMAAMPDVAALARARPEKLHKLWEGLGYYTRVRNMQRAAQAILDRHGGRFPDRFDDLLALPGIGRYTAGAVCSIAFNQPKPVLDGNVTRVLARLFSVKQDPRRSPVKEHLWNLAESLVREASVMKRRSGRTGTELSSRRPCSALNQALMELGATICTARDPDCGACPVGPHCLARSNGLAHLLPRRTARPKPTQRRFLAFLVEQKGRFLVRQRPAETVNAHLWEFPNIEVTRADGAVQAAVASLGVRPTHLEKIRTLQHSITRYRITLEVYRLAAPRLPARKSRAEVWLRPIRLKGLPFSAAHRSILRDL